MKQEAKSQMLEARTQIVDFLRLSLMLSFPILACSLVLELWMNAGVPHLFLGAMTGLFFAFGNLSLLFWLMAPFFFFGEKRLRFASAILLSLTLAALLTYGVSIFGTRYGLGYGLGVASPAFFGACFAIQTYVATWKYETQENPS